jgi:rhodanese-related sulfurtransferase
VETITPEALAAKSANCDIELIDVRTPVEFREMHVAGSKNIPLDTLDPEAVIGSLGDAEAIPLYMICRSGTRGGKACEKFIEAGYEKVVNVEGGVLAWDAASFPVNRGKKAISLERQVRITAGFLVFSGAVLGFFVNESFIALSAFVGAGLMFAGITDSCMMGTMLAKMPWNQVRDCDV